MTDIRSLEDLTVLAESVELECKLATGQGGRGKLPDDFWATYSAFANTHGGVVVLGVKEIADGFELKGVPEPDRLITDLFNNLNNPQKVSANLLRDQDVQKLALPGGTVIVVRIPQANRKDRPVYLFYRKVYRKLVADIKVPFALKDGQRQDETPVHEALREALVNTLVHADYTGRVSILVVKRPDLFGFRNPGGLRLPLEQVLNGGESDCRNRRMHQMFLLLGLGERAGSGVPKIYSDWASQHWRPPVLTEKDEPEQTLLELRMADLWPETVLAGLRARFGASFEALNQTERLIVATTAAETVVSHQRLLTVSGQHPHDLSMTLRKLVRDGFLISEGKAKGTVYALPGETHLTPEQVFDEAPAAAGSGDWVSSSVDSAPSSVDSDRGTGPYGRVVSGLRRPIVDTLEGLDDTLKANLLAKAEPIAQQGRSSQDRVKAAVLSLCADHYLTIGLLATLLKRTHHHLRNTVLNPLVAEQRLERAFPMKPNDPRQAYTCSENGDLQ